MKFPFCVCLSPLVIALFHPALAEVFFFCLYFVPATML